MVREVARRRRATIAQRGAFDKHVPAAVILHHLMQLLEYGDELWRHPVQAINQ